MPVQGKRKSVDVSSSPFTGYDATPRQRFPHPRPHPRPCLRLPPRQPLRPPMDHRPVPRQNRPPQRYRQRPQPRRRPPTTSCAPSARSSPSAWKPSTSSRTSQIWPSVPNPQPPPPSQYTPHNLVRSPPTFTLPKICAIIVLGITPAAGPTHHARNPASPEMPQNLFKTVPSAKSKLAQKKMGKTRSNTLKHAETRSNTPKLA